MQGLRQASEAGTQYPSSEVKELGTDTCWDMAKVPVPGHRDIRAIPKTPFNGTTPPSWASPVAQWKGILLPVQEMWVRSLGWEDPLEKEIAISPEEGILQYSCEGNPMDGGAWWATVHGITKESVATDQLDDNEQPPASLFVQHSL